MSQEGDETFLYRINLDGSGRRKAYPEPVIQLETVSPDGRWAVAQKAIPNEDATRGIFAIPLEGGTPLRICTGLCVVRWSLNGRVMFLSLAGGEQVAHITGWTTFVVPLSPGQMFPKLASAGVNSVSDAAALPGARSVNGFLLPGETEGTYAFARITVHRNLFRIPLS